MGIKDWLGIGDAVAKPIEAVGNLYTTDKARIEAETKYQEVIQQPAIAQASVNTILASSEKLFNSGWQPLIGWTAGFLILLFYAPQIIITTYIWAKACLASGIVTPFPMKPDEILNLVWLLFGFGGYSLIKRR